MESPLWTLRYYDNEDEEQLVAPPVEAVRTAVRLLVSWGRLSVSDAAAVTSSEAVDAVVRVNQAGEDRRSGQQWLTLTAPSNAAT